MLGFLTSSSLRIVAASLVTNSFSKWLMTILFIPEKVHSLAITDLVVVPILVLIGRHTNKRLATIILLLEERAYRWAHRRCEWSEKAPYRL